MIENTVTTRLGVKSQRVRNERGATAVEFGVIVILLLFSIFAIIEFAFLLYDKAVVTHAAREGARAGAVFRIDSNGDYSPVPNDEMIAVVNNYLAGHLLNLGGSTTAAPNPTPCPQDTTLPTRQVTVEVPFTYTFLTLPNLKPGGVLSVDLTSTSVMTCE